MSPRYACLALGLFAAACGVEAKPELGVETSSQEIINGSAVARGSLQSRGIVRVGNGCTGTLLTNRFVLTARHCVRQVNADNTWGASTAPVNVTLQGATPADDQVIGSNGVFEPGGNFNEAVDYALIRLASPMVVDGSTTDFVNEIYSGSDADLVGQTLFCAGFGNNALAQAPTPGNPNGTPSMGNGILRSANLTVTGATGNELTLGPNNLGQIGAGGDSGSTCFFGAFVTGVQSTCGGTSVDLNNDGATDSSELTTIAVCTSAAPSAYRAWAESIMYADATSVVTMHPPIAGTLLWTSFDSPRRSGFVAPPYVYTATDLAPRGSWYDAVMWSEPAGYFCTAERQREVPMAGAITARLACLSDGILPALF